MTAGEQVVFEFRRRGGVWVSTEILRRRRQRQIGAAITLTAAAGLVLMAGVLTGLYAQRPLFDAQSRAFANAAIAEIAPAWSKRALLARAAPDFTSVHTGAFDAWFATLKKLGPGAAGHDCTGAADLQPSSLFTPITATYTCAIAVKPAPAVAILTLRREAGAWGIAEFYVSPLDRPKGVARTD